jgi:hypothetical protein
MSKKSICFFEYGLAKLYLIFPIFQITRKLMHNDVFVHARSWRNKTARKATKLATFSLLF